MVRSVNERLRDEMSERLREANEGRNCSNFKSLLLRVFFVGTAAIYSNIILKIF